MDAELFKQVLAAAKDMSYEQLEEFHQARGEFMPFIIDREGLDFLLEGEDRRSLTDEEWKAYCEDMHDEMEDDMYFTDLELTRLNAVLHSIRGDEQLEQPEDDDDDDSDDDDE